MNFETTEYFIPLLMFFCLVIDLGIYAPFQLNRRFIVNNYYARSGVFGIKVDEADNYCIFGILSDYLYPSQSFYFIT